MAIGTKWLDREWCTTTELHAHSASLRLWSWLVVMTWLTLWTRQSVLLARAKNTLVRVDSTTGTRWWVGLKSPAWSLSARFFFLSRGTSWHQIVVTPAENLIRTEEDFFFSTDTYIHICALIILCVQSVHIIFWQRNVGEHNPLAFATCCCRATAEWFRFMTEMRGSPDDTNIPLEVWFFSLFLWRVMCSFPHVRHDVTLDT